LLTEGINDQKDGGIVIADGGIVSQKTI